MKRCSRSEIEDDQTECRNSWGMHVNVWRRSLLAFTVRLHVMRRTVFLRPFCPSVRPSVCQTRGLCQNESNLCPSSYTTSFILVFWQEEWLVGAIPATWNFGANWPCWSENADFQWIIARSASDVTAIEKVQLTLMRSPALRYALSSEPRMNMNIVRCPKHLKGGLKHAKEPFSV